MHVHRHTPSRSQWYSFPAYRGYLQVQVDDILLSWVKSGVSRWSITPTPVQVTPFPCKKNCSNYTLVCVHPVCTTTAYSNGPLCRHPFAKVVTCTLSTIHYDGISWSFIQRRCQYTLYECTNMNANYTGVNLLWKHILKERLTYPWGWVPNAR